MDKVESHVEDALAKGATLVAGGKRMEGNFYAPTIVTGASQDMMFDQDETFGPLAAVYKFNTEADAIKLANDTEYGLAG